jgi:hypothetical protein
MGPYRGVGKVMACFSMERIVEHVASRLGLDPLEVRRRNFVRSFPYWTPGGYRLESGDYPRSLELAVEALGWEELRAENERLRAEGRYRGLGVACGIEQTAHGGGFLASKQLEIVAGYDSASVRIEPDGKARVAEVDAGEGEFSRERCGGETLQAGCVFRTESGRAFVRRQNAGFQHARDRLRSARLRPDRRETVGRRIALVGAVEDLPIAQLAAPAEADGTRADSAEGEGEHGQLPARELARVRNGRRRLGSRSGSGRNLRARGNGAG